MQLAGSAALGSLATACSSENAEPAIPRFVDIHRHLLPNDLADVTSALQELDRWMVEKGVIQCVVPPAILIEEDQDFEQQASENLLAAFASYNNRMFPFVSVHPLAKLANTDLVNVLHWSKARGAKGFGELKPGNDLMIDDPANMAIFSACEESGLPVLFHLDSQNCIDDPGLPHLEKALKAFPELTFIAHGPGWWASISGDVTDRDQLDERPETPVVPGGAAPRLLAEYPNLYADLSASSGLNAITREGEFGLRFIEQFQDKLLFGSDTVPLWFIPEWGHFDFYGQLSLPAEIEAKVYRDNARRVIDLPMPD